MHFSIYSDAFFAIWLCFLPLYVWCQKLPFLIVRTPASTETYETVLYVSCRVPPPPMALSCSLAHLLWANASGDGVVCCHWEQVRAKIHAYTLALMKPYGFFWGASFFLAVPLKKKKKLICRVIFQLTLCGFSDVEPLGSTSLKFLESMNREQCDSHKWVNKAGVI